MPDAVDGSIDRQMLLSCLDEIDEHFDAIETVLLELTAADFKARLIDDGLIGSGLRAAHTVKGLSAMMGCLELGDVSHQFESFLKIIRVRWQSLQLDSELQTRLLRILDRMRQMNSFYRQGQPIEAIWMTRELIPLLDDVQSRLGELSESDEVALLSKTTDTDIVVVLFESEVEGLLQRLESVLADPELPCLREELDIVAQELVDLGQTLDLENFTALSQAIHQTLARSPNQAVEAIAHQAVKSWRESQTLILAGSLDKLPWQFKPPLETVEVLKAVEALEAVEKITYIAPIGHRQQPDSESTVALAKEGESKSTPETLSTEVMQFRDDALVSEVTPLENTVRVPVKLLVKLNDLFGELVIQRNSLDSQVDMLDGLVSKVDMQTAKLRSKDPEETAVQLSEASKDIKVRLRDILQASNDIKRTAKELQINVTRATMRPFSDVVKQFPRQVRELSAQYGKQVDFQVHGSSTLVDRHVVEALGSPLMHLLRNAFDHGIESPDVRVAAGKLPQGRIDVWATHRGNQTLIFVQDDGAGIDLVGVRDRAIQLGIASAALDNATEEGLISLIFEPGFSTAEQLSPLSGRGIGMDVVRTDLTKIRGTIKVSTQPGEGTTFTISVPFTLSTIRALLVEVGGIRLAFSTDSIQEVIRIKEHAIHASPGQDILAWEGLAVPLIRLDQWLTFNCSTKTSYQDDSAIVSEPIALLVHHESGLKGIYIDRYWGEREIIIRQVENVMPLPTGFIGCTILEDGRAVPLADTLGLIEWVAAQSAPAPILSRATPADSEPADSTPANSTPPAERLSTASSTLSLQSFELEPARNTPLLQAASDPTNTVLVVDNSINVRRLIADALEQAGYQVQQASNGEDAFKQLMEGLDVQVVLCDVEMPRLDGYSFLTKIKSQPQFKALPIVMVTSYGDKKHHQLAKRLGAVDYLTKPYQDYQLLEIVKRLVSQPTELSEAHI